MLAEKRLCRSLSICKYHSLSCSLFSQKAENTKVSIIGDVILKGKKEFWGRSNVHYHHMMKAGQNTLNADCARLMTRLIGDLGHYDRDIFLDRYIAFMQDPGSTKDVYAESFHRGFFANLVFEGKPPHLCGTVTIFDC